MKTFLIIKRCIGFAIIMMTSAAFIKAQNIQSDKFEYTGNTRVNKKNNITAAMCNVNSRVYRATPEEAARQFLNENKSPFGFENISDFKFIEIVESPAGKHVGFLQTYKGIPVYGSETVVSLNKENRVSMVVNGNRPVLDLKSSSASVQMDEAVKKAISKINAVKTTLVSQPKAELHIYQDSLSQFNLIWKINFVANSPIGDWEVLVDANSGAILKVTDISFHSVNGHGKVFKPDPNNFFAEFISNRSK